MDSIARVRAHAPGAQGVVYDKALRGKHKQTLLNTLGLLPVIRVPAKRAARATSKGVMPREPKDRHIEDKTVRLSDGTTMTFRVHAVDGALGIAFPSLDGELQFVPLERGRIRRVAAADGSFRWYGLYKIPEAFGGGGTLTIRLDITDEDRISGLNRTELLSPIPSSDPDFGWLATLRSDAESNNSVLEGTLDRTRAHSVGHVSQKANLLGYALLVNSVTLHLARRRDRVQNVDPPLTTTAA